MQAARYELRVSNLHHDAGIKQAQKCACGIPDGTAFIRPTYCRPVPCHRADNLDFADQVQRWSQSSFAFFPFSRANFAWVGSNILSRFDFTQQVRCVTADTFSGNFDSLDDTLWVNNEGGTVSQAFIFTHVVEVTGQGASRVTDHRVFDFRDGVRAAVPCFVGEVGIGRYGVHVHAQFLQFFVMVCYVAQFGWAYEGEVSRVEEEDAPATFGIFLSNFYEFTVFERLVFERLDFSIN